MASILVVDDNAANRKLLSVLLKHQGHATLEANDGEDGLATARAERPQLVISDILMPSMDGYEFVRRLRADPQIGEIPVIFYTAHHHEREARALAQTCGVARVLIKPSPVADILGAVERSLTGIPEMPQLKAHALQSANTRLEALTELIVQLTAEQTSDSLLEQACRGARSLLGARAAVVAVGEPAEPGGVRFATSGIEPAAAPLPAPQLGAGLLGRVRAQQRPLRVTAENNELLDTGLPPGYPDPYAVIAVPVMSLTQAHGWLCLLDKVGSRGFDAADERVLSVIGAQVGRLYEHLGRYAEVPRDRSSGFAESTGLESSLRGALQREEFVLHYQPKVDLRTRRLTGLEALMRWQNPELGLMPPDRFIPLMEENGMIVDVGAWALRRAIEDRKRWQEQGLPAPRIAVNVSTVQIRRAGFVRTLSDLLRSAGRDAGIDIEITESVIMDQVGDNIRTLNQIRDLGIGIALDDFGTGFSPLGYLARMPLETLKIDRSFIATMADDSISMTLLSSIISLAHNLKLDTVAEGVETEAQAQSLALLHCDQIQGYLVSKPLVFDDVTAYLGRSRSK
jgi:EAL domain-containing protein (putative c-di-GMP-specific phosphodiesterase class I)/DNA-binding NarL/FixJ family response regulator